MATTPPVTMPERVDNPERARKKPPAGGLPRWLLAHRVQPVGPAAAESHTQTHACRDATGVKPRCHFEWAEGNPVVHLLRYLLFGRGDTAPVVREIIRQVEPEPTRRPTIHVGG
jgi:hypothetical protein